MGRQKDYHAWLVGCLDPCCRTFCGLSDRGYYNSIYTNHLALVSRWICFFLYEKSNKRFACYVDGSYLYRILTLCITIWFPIGLPGRTLNCWGHLYLTSFRNLAILDLYPRLSCWNLNYIQKAIIIILFHSSTFYFSHSCTIATIPRGLPYVPAVC